MSPTGTGTSFGRYHVAEPFRAELLHLYKGAPLKETAWEIPFGALDQEDLLSQGIDTSALIHGAQKVDALGSCTANATTASLAERYTTAYGASSIGGIGLSATNLVENEEHAILFYHACTDQTGNPSEEWPPTDCGSTGLYCCQELMHQKFVTSYQTGNTAESLVSMLQSGSVIIGSPWFNSWFEPDGQGFVDNTGSMADFETAMNSGIAGGHETCVYQLPHLVLSETGAIDLQASWVQVRNSWSASFGLSGDYRVHLSTLNWLAQSLDYKQFVL